MNALQPKPLLKDIADQDAMPHLPMGRPARQWPWRTLARVTAGLAAAGLVAGATFTWWDRTTIHSGGPVTVGSGDNGVRLGVGEPISFGGYVLKNGGSKPAVLERVRVLGVTGGFEVLGLRTNPTPLRPDVYHFAGALGFPPHDYPSDPLADKHVVPVTRHPTKAGEPEKGLQLVIGARASEAGVARARGVEFTYRVGHRRYHRSHEGSMVICAPQAQFTAETCPGDAEEQFDERVVDFRVPR